MIKLVIQDNKIPIPRKEDWTDALVWVFEDTDPESSTCGMDYYANILVSIDDRYFAIHYKADLNTVYSVAIWSSRSECWELITNKLNSWKIDSERDTTIDITTLIGNSIPTVLEAYLIEDIQDYGKWANGTISSKVETIDRWYDDLVTAKAFTGFYGSAGRRHSRDKLPRGPFVFKDDDNITYDCVMVYGGSVYAIETANYESRSFGSFSSPELLYDEDDKRVVFIDDPETETGWRYDDNTIFKDWLPEEYERLFFSFDSKEQFLRFMKIMCVWEIDDDSSDGQITCLRNIEMRMTRERVGSEIIVQLELGDVEESFDEIILSLVTENGPLIIHLGEQYIIGSSDAIVHIINSSHGGLLETLLDGATDKYLIGDIYTTDTSGGDITLSEFIDTVTESVTSEYKHFARDEAHYSISKTEKDYRRDIFSSIVAKIDCALIGSSFGLVKFLNFKTKKISQEIKHKYIDISSKIIIASGVGLYLYDDGNVSEIDMGSNNKLFLKPVPDIQTSNYDKYDIFNNGFLFISIWDNTQATRVMVEIMKENIKMEKEREK